MAIQLSTKPLTPDYQRISEVEHRTTFASSSCLLNIFETHQKAERVQLRFDGFTVTSMLRGKKLLNLQDGPVSYLPGQSYVLPSSELMDIDFPDASIDQPTQCTALVIEDQYLDQTLAYFNEQLAHETSSESMWDLNNSIQMLINDWRMVQLSDELYETMKYRDSLLDMRVDLKLKELVLSIIQSQRRSASLNQEDAPNLTNRIAEVVRYLKRNALKTQIAMKDLPRMACMSKSSFYRLFVHELGVSPLNFIQEQRVARAKLLLASTDLAIKEVCYDCGFSDPNYFTRVFKMITGVSPQRYRASNNT